MMRDLSMTDSLKGTSHTKWKLKNTKDFFESRVEDRYLLKPTEDWNKLPN